MNNALYQQDHERMLWRSAFIVAVVIGVAIIAFATLRILTAHASTTPTVTTQIHDIAHPTVDIQGTTVLPGTTIFDSVMVTDATSTTTPTSTIDFHRYTAIDCTGVSTDQNDVALTNGIATSTPFITSVGSVSYRVHYDGNDAFAAFDAACESLHINTTATAVTTQVHNANHVDITNGAITFGSAVHDMAMVINASTTTPTSTPTGTATFELYAGTTCADPSIQTDDIALANGSAESVATSTLAIGDYSYEATYNGDATHGSMVAPCEVFSVIAQQQGTGTIIIQKRTLPIHATTTFAFTASYATSSFSLVDGQSNITGSLQPGTYSVTETSTPGWVLNDVRCSDGSNPNSINLAANETVVCVFRNRMTNIQTGTIMGKVFNDVNRNNKQDPNEPVLTGWGVTLWLGNQFVASTSSNLLGRYDFMNLVPGTYVVKETQQSGWKQIIPGGDGTYTIVVTAGSVAKDRDFANVTRSHDGTTGDGDNDDDDQGENVNEHSNRGNDKVHTDNGLHLGQLRRGNAGLHLGQSKNKD